MFRMIQTTQISHLLVHVAYVADRRPSQTVHVGQSRLAERYHLVEEDRKSEGQSTGPVVQIIQTPCHSGVEETLVKTDRLGKDRILLTIAHKTTENKTRGQLRQKSGHQTSLFPTRGPGQWVENYSPTNSARARNRNVPCPLIDVPVMATTLELE